MLYLWLLSVRGYSRAISMRVSHCTSHRQEGQLTGRTVQENKLHWVLTYSGQQIAKQLASQEDIVGVIVTEGVESVFGFLPSQV